MNSRGGLQSGLLALLQPSILWSVARSSRLQTTPPRLTSLTRPPRRLNTSSRTCAVARWSQPRGSATVLAAALGVPAWRREAAALRAQPAPRLHTAGDWRMLQCNASVEPAVATPRSSLNNSGGRRRDTTISPNVLHQPLSELRAERMLLPRRLPHFQVDGPA
jgi:hypothetical protein